VVTRYREKGKRAVPGEFLDVRDGGRSKGPSLRALKGCRSEEDERRK